MSSWKVDYAVEPQCPVCKWRDGGFDKQLCLVEKWFNQHGFGYVVECSECGRVTRVTYIYGRGHMQAVDCHRTVERLSIIPF